MCVLILVIWNFSEMYQNPRSADNNEKRQNETRRTLYLYRRLLSNLFSAFFALRLYNYSSLESDSILFESKKLRCRAFPAAFNGSVHE